MIPVVEIRQVRYWAYVAPYTVCVWQLTRPNTMARVAIIPLGDEPEAFA